MSLTVNQESRFADLWVRVFLVQAFNVTLLKLIKLIRILIRILDSEFILNDTFIQNSPHIL
jgi:hypothetical protein